MEVYEYGDPSAAVVLLQPVFETDTMEKEIELIREDTEKEFVLRAFKVADWNKDLSPWEAPAVFGREDFGSGAAETLKEILNSCNDDTKSYYIGGYSLAGFFALSTVILILQVLYVEYRIADAVVPVAVRAVQGELVPGPMDFRDDGKAGIVENFLHGHLSFRGAHGRG